MITNPAAEKRLLSDAVQTLAHHATELAAGNKVSVKGRAVYWLVRDGDWWALRCCGVHVTCRGCFRFTDREIKRVPKTIWPLPVDDRPPGGEMSITLHESELTSDYLRLVVEVACDPSKEIEHPAFEFNKLHGLGGVWSLKARAHVAASEAEQDARARKIRV